MVADSLRYRNQTSFIRYGNQSECLLISIFIVLKKGEGEPSGCSSLFSEVVVLQ